MNTSQTQRSEKPEDIFDAHIRGIHRERRQWPRHINSRLIDTLDRTLNPDPNSRPSIEEINEQLKLAYDGPRLMVASGLEKLADAFEDASRKAKSLWVLGQREAAVSILKNNLQTDPSQADLWYYLTKWEWEILNSEMSDLALEQLVDRAKDICAYAFRARILDAKFSQESHEDYQFINLILPQVAGQKYIVAKDMDGYYNWGKSFFAQQMEWLNSEEVKIIQSGGPVRCLCVKCGEIKMNITKRCPRCGFLPTEMKDIFHTYTLRIESVRFSEPEEPSYWAKRRYLKSLGENIDKAISNLYSDKEYVKQYDNFVQNEGKFLHQLIHFGGSKDEIANIMNYLRPSKKPNLKEKLRNYFKI